MFLHTTMDKSVSLRLEDSIGCPGLVGAKIRFARDQEIHREADDAKFIYNVASGGVRRYKLLSDGRRQIESFHLPGDVFGLESGLTCRLTAEAIVDTVAVIFDRSVLDILLGATSELPASFGN